MLDEQESFAPSWQHRFITGVQFAGDFDQATVHQVACCDLVLASLEGCAGGEFHFFEQQQYQGSCVGDAIDLQCQLGQDRQCSFGTGL